MSQTKLHARLLLQLAGLGVDLAQQGGGLDIFQVERQPSGFQAADVERGVDEIEQLVRAVLDALQRIAAAASVIVPKAPSSSKSL